MAPDQKSNAAPGRAAGAFSDPDLVKRLGSAAVLIPLVLILTWYGGLLFAMFWAGAGFAVLFEWMRLSKARADAPALLVGAAAVLSGAFAPLGLVALIAAGAAVILVLLNPSITRLWALSGLGYALAVSVAPVVLRIDPILGFAALIWLFAVVWGTDAGAYFAGRAIGGPKLWPALSPKKTWAGFIGGTLFGTVIALGFMRIGFHLPLTPGLTVSTYLIAAFSQGGDLFESWVKRHFGAKDSGALIPGHGGVMDRLDAFIFAGAAALCLGLVRSGGAGGAAQGLLVW